jgi:MOSC domain-containing protein YiiM
VAEDTARLVAICVGSGGIPKHPVDHARVTAEGLEGDGHRNAFHGGSRRAICLLSVEEVEWLAADGVRAAGPGTFGENLLVEGLALDALSPGDRLEFDGGVVLVLDDVRAPCATLKGVDVRFPDLMAGRSGWLCRVASGGELGAGATLSRRPGTRA